MKAPVKASDIQWGETLFGVVSKALDWAASGGVECCVQRCTTLVEKEINDDD